MALLVLQVADTPIFCADEGPAGEMGRTAHSAAPAGELHGEGPAVDDDSCFCPCHLTFKSEAAYRLTSILELAGLKGRVPARTPPAASRDLDHPPQNLG